jgi:hypothetical protein
LTCNSKHTYIFFGLSKNTCSLIFIQQSADRRVTLLGHSRGEADNTNLLIFVLTRSAQKLNNHTEGEHVNNINKTEWISAWRLSCPCHLIILKILSFLCCHNVQFHQKNGHRSIDLPKNATKHIKKTTQKHIINKTTI